MKVGLTQTSVRKRFYGLVPEYSYEILDEVEAEYSLALAAEVRTKGYGNIHGWKHWPQHRMTKDNRPFGRTECFADRKRLRKYMADQVSLLKAAK